MATFLSRFTHPGSNSFGEGARDRAIAAGYTPKQISVAITQGNHGLNIGSRMSPGGDLHTEGALSTKGHPSNWLHNYQNPSGAIGWDGLMAALGAGKTPEELIAAGGSQLLSGAGHTASYFPLGIMGYGEKASEYLAQFLKKPKRHDPSYAPPSPMSPPPPPGSRYGGADITAGYTAKGLASPQPENYDNTRGGTRQAFGRDKKGRDRRHRINPAMQINPITT